MLVEYVTRLLNKVVKDLGVSAVCIRGLCYFTRYEEDKCKVQYCKYNIFTKKEKCIAMFPQINNDVIVAIYNEATPFLESKFCKQDFNDTSM